MKNDRLKSILGIPYFLFLVIFVVCPVLILLYYAFTNGAGEFSLANFTLFFTDSKAIGTLIYSVMVAVVTTIVCLLIAYPVAYLLAKGEFRRGNVLLMLFVMPMWINFTLRITALKEILTLIEGNLAFHPFLNTVIGMTYDFLPFMILPIYNALVRIRKDLIEAARDLGAGNLLVFFKIILPLSLSGVFSGIIMVFVPALTSFVISDLLGGGKVLLIGNVIEQSFMQGMDWHLGSGLSIVLMIFVIASMAFMNRQDKENEGGNAVW
mgnify:CR=1 FL=1